MSNDTEAEKQHTSAIEPDDVVTLTSGGARFLVRGRWTPNMEPEGQA